MTDKEIILPPEAEPPPPDLFAILAMPPDADDLPKPVSPYYVVDRKHFYVHKQTKLGRVLVRLDEHPDNLPLFEYSGQFWADIPKIPETVLSQAWSFFKAVFQTHHAEAIVLLLMNQEREWTLFCPEQTVDYVSVEYEYNPKEIPDGYQVMGTIHSHCDFSAFHSSTDETDASKHDGLHMTFGKVDEDAIEVDVMVAWNGVAWKKEYSLTDVTDAEKITDKAEYPLAWLGSVTVEPIKTTNFKNPTASYGYAGWGDEYERYDNENLERYYAQGYQGSSAPARPISETVPTGLTWPADTDYSKQVKICAEQMEYDLHKLQKLAEKRGLDFHFIIHEQKPVGETCIVSR